MLPVVYLLTLLRLLSAVSAARILAIFPLAAKSHFTFNHAVLRSLHDAGHRITMITPFPGRNRENFTYVDSRFDSIIYVSNTTLDDVHDQYLSDAFNMAREIVQQYCYDVIKLPEIQEALNSPEKLYDILFLEVWFEHQCFTPIAQKLRIPTVGTVVQRTSKWADAFIGNPHNPAIVTGFLGPHNDMDFVERAINLWRYFAMDYYYFTRIRGIVEQFYKDHFSNDILLSEEEISLIFQNNFPSLLSRPLVQNTIEIGGIHVEPANSLPQDLQKFIDEAPHGVVLFSLGSIIRASSMSRQTRDSFVSAFKSIPQRVIWKFEDPIENLSQNVITSSWIPQRDILEHKNVIAFMSHWGIGGVYEAVWTGTPVITIPLFADQHVNAEILRYRGVGVGLDLKTVTKEKVLAALNTIINDTSYYKRMQEFSLVFKDRPMSPQQMVVYWTEYVIRHNGTRDLRAIGTDMPLHKYLMLDIVALILVTASAAVFVIIVLVGKFRFTKDTKLVDLVKKSE